MAKNDSSTRIQFDLKQRSMERLKDLKETTEAASFAEVVRRALQLYEALVVEVESGSKVYVEREEDGKVEVLSVF